MTTSGSIKLMDYKECEVWVDITGKFWTKINGQRVEDRSLAKVKKAIENAEPVAKVFSFTETAVRWASFSLNKRSILAGEVAWYAAKVCDGRIPGLAEYDPAVVEKMGEIEARWRDDVNVIEARVMAEKQAILDALPRLNPDRLNELIEDDRAVKMKRK
jgi:hypothetical protein